MTRPCHVVVSTESLRSVFGPHWFFNGVPIFSDGGQEWVSSRTGQQVQWSEFQFPIYRPTSPVIFGSHKGDSGLLDIIDRSTASRILGPLFSSYAPVVFPVIDPILFETTIETAYEILDGPLSSFTHIAAQACVLAALSIASRMETPDTSLLSPAREEFAAKAQCLLSLIPGYMNLDTLITVLLLVSGPCCSSGHDGSMSESTDKLKSKCNAHCVAIGKGRPFTTPSPVVQSVLWDTIYISLQIVV